MAAEAQLVQEGRQQHLAGRQDQPEVPVGQLAVSGRLRCLDEPGLHCAFSLDLDGPARLAHVGILNENISRGRDVDPPRDSMGFHAGRRVDSVSPYVVLELEGADDSAHYRA